MTDDAAAHRTCSEKLRVSNAAWIAEKGRSERALADLALCQEAAQKSNDAAFIANRDNNRLREELKQLRADSRQYWKLEAKKSRSEVERLNRMLETAWTDYCLGRFNKSVYTLCHYLADIARRTPGGPDES